VCFWGVAAVAALQGSCAFVGMGLTTGPSNVVVLTKIAEGVTEQQVAAGAGRCSEVLQVSYRPSDMDGLGWAIVAFASPELARSAVDRLHGKPLPGIPIIGPTPALLEAELGDGLFGPIRRADDQDSPWREARTLGGQVYYYHAVTRQTSWTKPLAEFPPPPPPGGRSMPPGVPPPPRPGASPHVASGSIAALVASQAAQFAASAAAQAPAEPREGRVSGSASGPVGANLFVYHIPNSWDDGILRQHFEHFGGIVSCRIQKDAEGRARGFGFISYDSASSAQAAIAGMHGFPVEGKWLKVQLKKGDEQQINGPQSLGGPSLAGLVETAIAATQPAPTGLGLSGAPPPPPAPGVPLPGLGGPPLMMPPGGAPSFALARPPPLMGGMRPGPY